MANFDITESDVKTPMEPEELKPITYNNEEFTITTFKGTFPSTQNQHSFVIIDTPFSDIISYSVVAKNNSGLMVDASGKNPQNANFGHNLTNGGVYLYTYSKNESAFVFNAEAIITIISNRS